MSCLPRRGQQCTDRFYIIVLPFIVKGKSKMQNAKSKKQNAKSKMQKAKCKK